MTVGAPEMERGLNAASANGAPPSESVLERLGRRLGRHQMGEVVMQSEAPSNRDGYVMKAHAASESLRELARGALRGVFLADVRTNDPESQCRELLRKACGLARESDIHVEQLLILLKETWLELPQPRHANHRDAQERLSRVVSLCIEEYYAPMRST